MTAVFYVAMGTFMAFIVREVFYVPKQFQYGILIMVSLLSVCLAEESLKLTSNINLGCPFELGKPADGKSPDSFGFATFTC